MPGCKPVYDGASTIDTHRSLSTPREEGTPVGLMVMVVADPFRSICGYAVICVLFSLLCLRTGCGCVGRVRRERYIGGWISCATLGTDSPFGY